MCNFNAKFEEDSDGYESCIGRHEMGDKNDNGERLYGFSVANGINIVSAKRLTRQHKSLTKNEKVKNKVEQRFESTGS